jgi:putative membrane protein
MVPEMHWGPLLAALIYSAVGLIVFAVAFLIVDRMTPYHLWKEIIDEQNTALAIIVGAVAIGIAIIVSSAIH